MKSSATLAHLAVPGRVLLVRVTPKSARNQEAADGERIRVQVTAAPEDDKATEVVVALLAKALGIPKSRLELVRGATSRHKQFRVL